MKQIRYQAQTRKVRDSIIQAEQLNNLDSIQKSWCYFNALRDFDGKSKKSCSDLENLISISYFAGCTPLDSRDSDKGFRELDKRISSFISSSSKSLYFLDREYREQCYIMEVLYKTLQERPLFASEFLKERPELIYEFGTYSNRTDCQFDPLIIKMLADDKKALIGVFKENIDENIRLLLEESIYARLSFLKYARDSSWVDKEMEKLKVFTTQFDFDILNNYLEEK